MLFVSMVRLAERLSDLAMETVQKAKIEIEPFRRCKAEVQYIAIRKHLDEGT